MGQRPGVCVVRATRSRGVQQWCTATVRRAHRKRALHHQRHRDAAHKYFVSKGVDEGAEGRGLGCVSDRNQKTGDGGAKRCSRRENNSELALIEFGAWPFAYVCFHSDVDFGLITCLG